MSDAKHSIIFGGFDQFRMIETVPSSDMMLPSLAQAALECVKNFRGSRTLT